MLANSDFSEVPQLQQPEYSLTRKRVEILITVAVRNRFDFAHVSPHRIAFDPILTASSYTCQARREMYITGRALKLAGKESDALLFSVRSKGVTGVYGKSGPGQDQNGYVLVRFLTVNVGNRPHIRKLLEYRDRYVEYIGIRFPTEALEDVDWEQQLRLEAEICRLATERYEQTNFRSALALIVALIGTMEGLDLSGEDVLKIVGDDQCNHLAPWISSITPASRALGW